MHKPAPQFPRLGHGIGLRHQHWNRILEEKPQVDWFEVISENFMDTEGRPLRMLEKIRQDYPIACHGVSLSIGSTDPLDMSYLNKLKELVQRVEPAWVSDHLCWTGVQGKQSHDLLPLPQIEESVAHIVERIDQVQQFLNRPILIENVSSYVSFKDSTMTEWEFLTAIAKRSGCGILLDINNIYVNAFNHGFKAETFLRNVPIDHVAQFHLAGHTDRKTFLFDTHSARMTEPVWNLYASAVKIFGNIPTLVEWDSDVPDFDVLQSERQRAMEIEKHARA